MNAVCPKCKKEPLRTHCDQACDWYICRSCKTTFGHVDYITKQRLIYDWSDYLARRAEKKKNGL